MTKMYFNILDLSMVPQVLRISAKRFKINYNTQSVRLSNITWTKRARGSITLVVPLSFIDILDNDGIRY